MRYLSLVHWALVELQGRLESAARRWAEKPNRVPDGHAVCHLIENFGEDA